MERVYGKEKTFAKQTTMVVGQMQVVVVGGPGSRRLWGDVGSAAVVNVTDEVNNQHYLSNCLITKEGL